MNNPQNIIDSQGTTDPVIAGNGGGIKVHCTREALPVYNALVNIAKSGNHHARLAVSGIVGLSCGHSHMDNIYKPNATALSQTRKEIYMAILPGIRVIFKQQDNSAFKVLKIDLDDTYTRQQREATSPGLWRAKREGFGDNWAAQFVKDGKLDANARNRFVIITDRTDKSPDDEATEIFETLKNSRDKTTLTLISNDGFDLHYTPGKKSIGGWGNTKEVRHANNRASLKESAEVLAHTMYHARDISGVVWGSESGGSGVLTQAMQILTDQGVSLKSHGIFLNRATTMRSKVVELARKLDIKADNVTKNSTFSRDQLIGQLFFLDTPITKLERLKNDDNYTLGSLGKDAMHGTYNTLQNTNTTIAAAGLFGATIAKLPAVGMAGGILALSSIVIKASKSFFPEKSSRHIGRK